MKEQYIGTKLVSHVVSEEFKTQGGGDIVTVCYADGSKELMPLVSFDLLKSSESVDLTALRDIKVNDLVKKILDVIAEHDLKMGEVS